MVKILSKPPGIGARSNIKIAGKDTVGVSSDCQWGTPIGEWEIGVQGESAAIGGGNMLAASEFIKLKVEEPYLTMKINMAAVGVVSRVKWFAIWILRDPSMGWPKQN